MLAVAVKVVAVPDRPRRGLGLQQCVDYFDGVDDARVCGGCLVSIALGFVGAVVGLLVARGLGLPELFALRVGESTFPVVWSILGSALFVAVIGLLTRSP